MPPASNNRQKLINAAVELFSLYGYAGVSIRDLCREVGIKESSFYNHFRGKDELMEHILETFRQRYRQLMPAADMLDSLLALPEPADFWRETLQRFLDLLADPEMRCMNRILNLEQYRNPAARAILQEEVIQRPLRYAELVCEKYIAQGKIRAYPPRQLAQSYYLPLMSLFMQYFALDAAGEDTASVVDQCREHIQFFSQMVQPA